MDGLPDTMEETFDFKMDMFHGLLEIIDNVRELGPESKRELHNHLIESAFFGMKGRLNTDEAVVLAISKTVDEQMTGYVNPELFDYVLDGYTRDVDRLVFGASRLETYSETW